jgi:DMSO/TMAO reductase YedYZ molybdopterin-dependent catalytic subunit
LDPERREVLSVDVAGVIFRDRNYHGHTVHDELEGAANEMPRGVGHGSPSIARPRGTMTAPMSAAAVDRTLAVLVVAMAATGALSLRAGAPNGGWIFLLHDVIAGVLALMVALKLRRSVPRAAGRRRFVRLAFGLLLAFFAIAALTGGYLWVASGEIDWVDAGALGRWTVLTLHAWAGLILLPVVVVHLLPTRWRLLRPATAVARCAPRRRITRRALLAGGAMAVAGGALWAGTSALELLARGSRRFTGSRFLPVGSLPIATTFLGEPTSTVNEASWRLSIDGAVDRPMLLDLAALHALGDDEVSAVLDCTSGWAVDTTWRGVALGRVLDTAGLSATASRIEVRSVTGWATSLDRAASRGALLAWSVGGTALPAANGAPVRLVLPDHRGLDWVKWVDTIRVA